MRRWIFPGLVLLLAASPAPGQTTYPAEAIITVPEVEVRSGPSKEFDATSKLRIGDRVFVRKESKENPGWLEITPPPSSFSWIDAKSIELVDRYSGIVRSTGPVRVRPGSSVTDKPPKTERGELPPGTLVVVLDKPMQHEGTNWLPIRPHLTEVRYIPAEAVKKENGVQNPNSTFVAPSNPLLKQAEAAYRAGDRDRAYQLYKEVYDKTTNPDHKIFAGNRLSTLSAPGKSPWQPGPSSLPAQTTSTTRQQPNSSLYNTGPAGTRQQLTYPPQWSVKGRLRRTAYEKDGQPMYVLENNYGQPLMYVTPHRGLRLNDFLGREIALYGPIVYRSDEYIRTHYMTATHVALY